MSDAKHGGPSPLVDLLSRRASWSQQQTRGSMRTEMRRLIQSNPQRQEHMEYDSRYFSANTEDLCEQDQLVARGVSIQMRCVENILLQLQRSVYHIDLELKYETLTAEPDSNSIQQKINEWALDYYHELGRWSSIQEIMQAGMIDISGTLDLQTGGAVSRATNYILEDITSPTFLGLECLDDLDTSQRREALVQAVQRVSDRMRETPFGSTTTFVSATPQQLEQLDKEHQHAYASAVVYINGTPYPGRFALKDIYNGAVPGLQLPIAEADVVPYYLFMKRRGMSVTGRITGSSGQ